MLQLITPPTAEPIYLAEARQHLKDPPVSEDTRIALLIAQARERAEHRTGRQLMAATFDLHLDCWPDCAHIALPRPPLQSVTHVKYYDVNGDLQTFASSSYHVDAVSEPGRLVLAAGAAWPALQERPNAVVVRFVCGYADTYNVPAASATTVPAAIRQWMLIQIASGFENMQAEVPQAVQLLPYVDRLLDPWIVYAA